MKTTKEKHVQNQLKEAIAKYGSKITLAMSFSEEDILIAYYALSIHAKFNIFALDTGRLPEETYECAEALQKSLQCKINWFFPNTTAVEKVQSEHSPLFFKESIENRKLCCQIRKVEPLSRALKNMQAWVTGMRRSQSITRANLQFLEEDPLHKGLLKLNPLADWSAEEVKAAILEYKLPQNSLLRKGFASIGCAPCTRAIQQGEDERAGRWWWESPEHRECGLHIKPILKGQK